MTKIQAVRGMNDILPDQTIYWQKLENIFRVILASYGYHEIRLPLLEKTQLFKRGIGEATDIIEKEMYTFLDRHDESLSLRPEGTAGCVRAVIEHGLAHRQTQKLWYAGPMFRYERPQKGRYRQFFQWGVETFGYTGHLIEAELILLMTRCFEKLGISQKVNLQLNILGSLESRLNYREKLVTYCQQHYNILDEDSRRRLITNPLRILDSKNNDIQAMLKQGPQLKDYLDEPSKNIFNQLCELLQQLNIVFDINPYLVRGLDYYTGTVFEWVTSHLGAQGTVCAGGRYDGLTAELGGAATPAVGFALGFERLVEICDFTHNPLFNQAVLNGYFIVSNTTASQAVHIAEHLRNALPEIKLDINYSGGNIKTQFKHADKSGARFALIMGEDESLKNMITFKDLRQDTPQICLTLSDLITHLRKFL